MSEGFFVYVNLCIRGKQLLVQVTCRWYDKTGLAKCTLIHNVAQSVGIMKFLCPSNRKLHSS